MFQLPTCPELRAMIDTEMLMKTGTGEMVVTLAEARAAAVRVLADPAVMSVACIVVKADGWVKLLSFNKDGMVPADLWTFGKL